MCDEISVDVSKVSEKPGSVKLLNRFDSLQHHVGNDEHDEVFETIDVTLAYGMMSYNKKCSKY